MIKLFAFVFLAINLGFASIGHSYCDHSCKAWAAWQAGNIEEAKEKAEIMLTEKNYVSEARHLLTLVHHVKGNYREALAQFKYLDASYPRYKELFDEVIESYAHLREFSKIVEFLKLNGLNSDWYRVSAQLQEMNPLSVEINSTTVIPFADNEIGLTPYFPGVDAQIKGTLGKWNGVARLDTGGTFLHMTPALAKRLGIATPVCTKGSQGGNETQVCFGIAKEFSVGAIKIKNIPVETISTLNDEVSPIFGTNFLQNFLVTIDYPAQQFTFSPKSAHKIQKPVSRQCEKMPFYMWGNHYMFARGGFGGQTELNFFIDTGLVHLTSDLRQSAIIIADEDLTEWGYEYPKEGIFDPHAVISLGNLSQAGHLISHEPIGRFNDFGGVRIHGLLGHAFYQKYVWTIDFDNRMYYFCQ